MPGGGEVEVPVRRSPGRWGGAWAIWGPPPPISGVKSPDFPSLALCLDRGRRRQTLHLGLM